MIMINYTAMSMEFHPSHCLLSARNFLSAVLCLPLLSACIAAPSGPGTAETPAETASTAASVQPRDTAMPTATPEPVSRITVETGDLKGIEVQFWHPWDGQTAQTVQTLVDRFNRENEWGIRVTATPAGTADALDTRLLDALDAGAPPMLVAAYLHQALAWDAQHPLADLDGYVSDPDWGFSAESLSSFYPEFWEQGVIDGIRVGLPALRYAVMLYYNQTWAEELGFDGPPNTPDSFREQACSAARALRQDEDSENDGRGGYMISLDYAAALGWISAFGGEITVDNGYRFDSKETRAALTYLRELYDDGCAFLVEGRSPEADFASRQGLFTTGSLAAISYQADAFRRAENRDRWLPLAFPSPGGVPAVTAYGPSYVLFTAPPEQELASFLFVRWMMDPARQAELALASSSFPLSEDAAMLMQAASSGSREWWAGLKLLPQADAEPSLASWKVVRWALQDAYTQLFRSYFSAAQVPELTEFLDETAEELVR